MTAYAVDVDELVAVISSMASCGRDLVDLATEVESAQRAIHTEWGGQASTAHSGWHSQWRESFADMTVALAALRALGDTARANYTAAVDANTTMWEQVR
ncbi:WXG100 family type VII secretion target [Nocardioides sp.]|uniref:WXG100 family type VII secretion target n=1 Tax=Nocardioides sp. TaxID=35761 RepID=UPI002CFAE81E|nr:WXG100 family type VII secretion target [Nocardioides sp.]HXH78960.1 WXG100 family type VII secretion target [Nocardioides sp.]